jgi:hypothetical protein
MSEDLNPLRNPCFNPQCPACIVRRLHTEEEWKLHPFAGHGFTKEQGYTHPRLAELAEEDRQTSARNVEIMKKARKRGTT